MENKISKEIRRVRKQKEMLRNTIIKDLNDADTSSFYEALLSKKHSDIKLIIDSLNNYEFILTETLIGNVEE